MGAEGVQKSMKGNATTGFMGGHVVLTGLVSTVGQDLDRQREEQTGQQEGEVGGYRGSAAQPEEGWQARERP